MTGAKLMLCKCPQASGATGRATVYDAYQGQWVFLQWPVREGKIDVVGTAGVKCCPVCETQTTGAQTADEALIPKEAMDWIIDQKRKREDKGRQNVIALDAPQFSIDDLPQPDRK